MEEFLNLYNQEFARRLDFSFLGSRFSSNVEENELPTKRYHPRYHQNNNGTLSNIQMIPDYLLEPIENHNNNNNNNGNIRVNRVIDSDEENEDSVDENAQGSLINALNSIRNLLRFLQNNNTNNRNNNNNNNNNNNQENPININSTLDLLNSIVEHEILFDSFGNDKYLKYDYLSAYLFSILEVIHPNERRYTTIIPIYRDFININFPLQRQNSNSNNNNRINNNNNSFTIFSIIFNKGTYEYFKSLYLEAYSKNKSSINLYQLNKIRDKKLQQEFKEEENEKMLDKVFSEFLDESNKNKDSTRFIKEINKIKNRNGSNDDDIGSSMTATSNSFRRFFGIQENQESSDEYEEYTDSEQMNDQSYEVNSDDEEYDDDDEDQENYYEEEYIVREDFIVTDPTSNPPPQTTASTNPLDQLLNHGFSLSKFLEKKKIYKKEKKSKLENYQDQESLVLNINEINCILLNKSRWESNLVFSGFEDFLTKLTLIDSNINDIERQLGNLRNLTYLNLTHNLLKASVSLNGLRRFKKLEVLILDQNRITLILPESFRECPMLRLVSLVKTDLRDLVPTRIALQENKLLSELYIKENSFTYQFSCLKKSNTVLAKTLYYREYLITHLPQLKVLDDIEITDLERNYANEVGRKKFILRDTWRDKHQLNQIYRDMLNLEINSGISNNSRALVTSKYQQYSKPKRIFKSLTEQKDILNVNPSIKSIDKILYPRQLEYNQNYPNLIAVGSMKGRVLVYDEVEDKVVYENFVSNPSMVLGLSWIKSHPCFIAGSEKGSIDLFNVDKGYSNTNIKNINNSTMVSFEPFNKLTSLHTNCNSDTMVVSGSADFVSIYDINTCSLTKRVEKAHTKKINVVKYASYDPYSFVTSSFDRSVKRWDTRCINSGPTLISNSNFGEIIMSVFSPDDRNILVSGCDNQVYQIDSRTGGVNIKFEIQKSNQEYNFSRSYYTADGNYCVIGSCDENCIRFYSTTDGKFLRDVSLFEADVLGTETDGCLSLRTHPINNFDVCVIKTKLSNLYTVKF